MVGGACLAGGCMAEGEHAWQGACMVGVCVAGEACVVGWHAWWGHVGPGGMHDRGHACMGRGHVWQGGVCSRGHV